jgi:hypothetical protein
VPTSVAEAFEPLANEVWEHLTNPPPSVRNVSEWSKKLACWEILKQKPVKLPQLSRELVPGTSPHAHNGRIAGENSGGIQAIPAVTWSALAHWGDETGKLKYWERGLAQSLAEYVLRRRQPSDKQTRLGLRNYRAAVAAGFKAPS